MNIIQDIQVLFTAKLSSLEAKRSKFRFQEAKVGGGGFDFLKYACVWVGEESYVLL